MRSDQVECDCGQILERGSGLSFYVLRVAGCFACNQTGRPGRRKEYDDASEKKKESPH